MYPHTKTYISLQVIWNLLKDLRTLLVAVTNSSVSSITLVGHNRTSSILELPWASQSAEPAHRQLSITVQNMQPPLQNGMLEKRKNLTFVKFRATCVSLFSRALLQCKLPGLPEVSGNHLLCSPVSYSPGQLQSARCGSSTAPDSRQMGIQTQQLRSSATQGMDDIFVCGLGFRRGKLKNHSEGYTNLEAVCIK